MEKNKLQNAINEITEVMLTSIEKASMKKEIFRVASQKIVNNGSGIVDDKSSEGNGVFVEDKSSEEGKFGLISIKGLYTDSIPSPFGMFSIGKWVERQKFANISVYIVVAIILLAGSGITAASRKSLPGDALYSLKVNVVEPIKSAFIATPVSRAEWDTKLVSTRFSEAEALAVTGKLDNSKQQQISNLIDNSVADFKKSIDEVKANSSLEADMLNVALQAHIDAHTKILDSIINDNSSSHSLVDNAYSKISNSDLKSSDSTSSRIADMPNSTSSIRDSVGKSEDKKISTDFTDKIFHAQTEKIQKNIDKSFSAIPASISTSTSSKQTIINEARSSLNDAQSSLNKAEDNHNAGDTSGSYSSLLKSEGQTIEAKVIMDNSNANANTNVKTNDSTNTNTNVKINNNTNTSSRNSDGNSDNKSGNNDSSNNSNPVISGDTRNISGDTRKSNSDVKVEYLNN